MRTFMISILLAFSMIAQAQQIGGMVIDKSQMKITSFTTDTTKTGYSSSQTINPSELNMWRVIKINNNVVEIISEYVSSEMIWFSGQEGYKNIVGYLNQIYL